MLGELYATTHGTRSSMNYSKGNEIQNMEENTSNCKVADL
jgi:hypothetical protein